MKEQKTRVRYEVQISKMGNGRSLARVHDDYWDISNAKVINRDNRFEMHNLDVELFNGASKLLPDEPGWYAVEVEGYPFGNPTCIFKIPGRHLRYRADC